VPPNLLLLLLMHVAVLLRRSTSARTDPPQHLCFNSAERVVFACHHLAPQIDKAPELIRPSSCATNSADLVVFACHHFAPQIDKAPELIRPSNCTKDSKLRDPTNEPNVDWLPVCRNAKQECTAQAQRARPYLKCTYTSLSTFWEIQRWIRNHGSVVTR
jgi:hypothetical protein